MRIHLLKVYIRFSLLKGFFSIEKERLLFPFACGYINWVYRMITNVLLRSGELSREILFIPDDFPG